MTLATRFTKAIPDRATIVKMRLNQSLVDLNSCTFRYIYGLIRFRAPITEAIFFEILSICVVQERWLSIYTPRDVTESTLFISRSLILIMIVIIVINSVFAIFRLSLFAISQL